MAHRTFHDRYGLPWEVWDVIPGMAERRAGADRRDMMREIMDRRQPHGYWIGVRHELADGWLCFQNGAEKRRLAPIPAAWERLPEDELNRLLEIAQPAGIQSRSV